MTKLIDILLVEGSWKGGWTSDESAETLRKSGDGVRVHVLKMRVANQPVAECPQINVFINDRDPQPHSDVTKRARHTNRMGQ